MRTSVGRQSGCTATTTTTTTRVLYYLSSMVVEDEGCGTVLCRLGLDCEARLQRRKGSWGLNYESGLR